MYVTNNIGGGAQFSYPFLVEVVVCGRQEELGLHTFRMSSLWTHLGCSVLHWRQIAPTRPMWVVKVTDSIFIGRNSKKIFLAQSIGSKTKREDLEYELLTPSSF